MCTVDTDVVIILLGKFSLLHKINSDAAIWVALGTGILDNNKYLHLHHGDGNGMRVVEAGVLFGSLNV